MRAFFFTAFVPGRCENEPENFGKFPSNNHDSILAELLHRYAVGWLQRSKVQIEKNADQ